MTADRLPALRLGRDPARILAETDDAASGTVALSGQTVRLVPFRRGGRGIWTVPLDPVMLRTGRGLRICFGDEPAGRVLNSLVVPTREFRSSDYG